MKRSSARHPVRLGAAIVALAALVMASAAGPTNARAATDSWELVVGPEIVLPGSLDDFGAASVTWDRVNANYVVVELPYAGAGCDVVRWRRLDPATGSVTPARELCTVFGQDDYGRAGLVSAWDGSGVVVLFSRLPGLRSMRINADDTPQWQPASGRVWEIAATTLNNGDALAAYDLPYDGYGLETRRYSRGKRTWATQVTGSPRDAKPAVVGVGEEALLAWETPAGIAAGRVDPTARVAMPPTGIPVAIGGKEPALAQLGGGALTVWRRADGALAARSVGPLGEPTGDEFQVVDPSTDPRRPGAITVSGVPIVAWFAGPAGALRLRSVTTTLGDVHEISPATRKPQWHSPPAMSAGRPGELAIAYATGEGFKVRLVRVAAG